MGNLRKMSLKMLLVLFCANIFAVAMLFSLTLIPESMKLLIIIICFCFIAFEYVLIWENMSIFGTKDSLSTSRLNNRLKETPELVTKDDYKLRYISYKGYIAGIIGSIPWIIVYIGAFISRLINLDPNIGSNALFKFLLMFFFMPFYSLSIELKITDAVPFAFIIPIVIAPIVSGIAYQMGHIKREKYLKEVKKGKYKRDPFR